jgi:hypothetical protein
LEIPPRHDERGLDMTSEKEVYNKTCGALGCNVTVSNRVVFSVGFSANFCERCAAELVSNGLGVIGRHQDYCANRHTEGEV